MKNPPVTVDFWSVELRFQIQTELCRKKVGAIQAVESAQGARAIRGLMGKGRLELPRLAAHGPKPCLSASSSTSPSTTERDILPFWPVPCLPGRVFSPDTLGHIARHPSDILGPPQSRGSVPRIGGESQMSQDEATTSTALASTRGSLEALSLQAQSIQPGRLHRRLCLPRL